MRSWILALLSVFVLGTTAIETIHTALDPELGACADEGDDERCPPFSDDCQDCAQCVHVSALPASVASLLPLRSPVSADAPRAPRHGSAPKDAPASEILTVPRA